MFYDKETKHRTFAPMKNNLAIDPTSVVFTVNSQVEGGRVEIIDWKLDKTADDIAGEMREEYQHGRGRNLKELPEAIDWLRGFLQEGRKPVGNENNPAEGSVRYESDKSSHKWGTIRRAYDALGIVSKKDMNVYFWELPSFPKLTPSQVAQKSVDNQERNNFAQPAFNDVSLDDEPF